MDGTLSDLGTDDDFHSERNLDDDDDDAKFNGVTTGGNLKHKYKQRDQGMGDLGMPTGLTMTISHVTSDDSRPQTPRNLGGGGGRGISASPRFEKSVHFSTDAPPDHDVLPIGGPALNDKGSFMSFEEVQSLNASRSFKSQAMIESEEQTEEFKKNIKHN